jgi:hypothetical protein
MVCGKVVGEFERVGRSVERRVQGVERWWLGTGRGGWIRLEWHVVQVVRLSRAAEVVEGWPRGDGSLRVGIEKRGGNVDGVGCWQEVHSPHSFAASIPDQLKQASQSPVWLDT